MAPRLVSLLLFSTHLASAGLPEAATLAKELSAAHAELPGFVATWHAEGEGKSLDLTIAEDRATGRFAFHLLATGPHGKIDSRQWSPDGKLVFVDNNGMRKRITCMDEELAFMRGFGEVFLDRKEFDAIGLRISPAALLSASSIAITVQANSAGEPGWARIATDLATAEVAGDRVVFISTGFGRLSIDRASGVLLRQEIQGEQGEARVLERVAFRTGDAAEEITRMTADWTTLGATDAGIDAASMASRMMVLQMAIDGVESGQASLEKLEEKLARKDELLEYGRRSLIKSPLPVVPVPDWDKVLAKTREEARLRWKATLPAGGAEDGKAFANYLAEPANRVSLRNDMADAITVIDEMVPLVVPQIFGPKMGDGLKAESATGKVAKNAIEAALCRAYLAAMLEEKMAAAWGERENLD